MSVSKKKKGDSFMPFSVPDMSLLSSHQALSDLPPPLFPMPPGFLDTLHKTTGGKKLSYKKVEEAYSNMLAASFGDRIESQATAFVDWLETSAAGQDFMRQGKLRGRLAAYFFLCLYTTTNVEAGLLDTSVDRNSFSYEKEILDHKWIVPLTGNLKCDVYCNFLAKKMSKATPGETIAFLREMIPALRIVAMDMTSSQFSEVTTLLPSLANEADYAVFLSAFQSRPKTEEVYGMMSKPLASLSLINMVKGKEGWQEAFSLYMPLGSDPTYFFSYYPDEGVIDTSVNPKGWNGININGCFDSDELREGAIPDELYPDDTRYIASAATFAKLLNLERQDLISERQRIKKAESLSKKDKRDSVHLLKEIETLKADLAKAQEESSLREDVKQREMNEELVRLRQMLSVQEGKLAKKDRTIDSIRKSLETERMQREALESEIEALQAIALQFEEQEQAKKDDDSLDTSVFDELRVVSFGGHPTWLKGMRSLHPNITFYSGDAMPSEVISFADIVWMQTNAIDHRTFYRLINEIRTKNVPLRYFTFAGHVACRKQMVEETKDFVKKRSGQESKKT